MAQQDKAQQDKAQQDILQNTPPVIADSDTTESTPDIFRSRVRDVVGTRQSSPVKETMSEVAATRQRRRFQYVGTTHVAETEEQGNTSDSDDNISVATLLNRQEKGSNLTLDQIRECEEGPKGEKAIGVSVTKMFGEDKYVGKVDRYRTVRQRIYYHVVYTGGDEEEMTQTELRNAYVLGLLEVIIRRKGKDSKTVQAKMMLVK